MLKNLLCTLGVTQRLLFLFPNRTPRNPFPGKPDKRVWLGDIHIAHQRVTGRNAGCGRIGKHRDVGKPRLRKLSQFGVDLGHLHQRKRALHHPCPARPADQDQRQSLLCASADQPANAFALCRSQGAHNEPRFMDAHADPVTVDPPNPGADSRPQPCRPTALLQPVGISDTILKMQGIDGSHPLGNLLKRSLVHQQAEILAMADAEVRPAVGADAKALLDLPAVGCQVASLTLDPQIIRHPSAYHGPDARLQLIEPVHIRLHSCQLQNPGNKRSCIRHLPDREYTCQGGKAQEDFPLAHVNTPTSHYF